MNGRNLSDDLWQRRRACFVAFTYQIMGQTSQ
jgi:hypothetical protein